MHYIDDREMKIAALKTQATAKKYLASRFAHVTSGAGLDPLQVYDLGLPVIEEHLGRYLLKHYKIAYSDPDSPALDPLTTADGDSFVAYALELMGTVIMGVASWYALNDQS